MERVKLWRKGRQKLVGVVELDEDNRRLIYHIDDEADLDERYASATSVVICLPHSLRTKVVGRLSGRRPAADPA